MSCTFWNMRRRKAKAAAKENKEKAEAEKVTGETAGEAEKKPIKKGGGKNGK